MRTVRAKILLTALVISTLPGLPVQSAPDEPDAALLRAVRASDTTRALGLLRSGAHPGNPAAHGDPLLTIASRAGNLHLVRALVLLGHATIPIRAYEALVPAVQRGRADIVDLILRHTDRRIIDRFGPDLLRTAIESGSGGQTVKVLAARGADINRELWPSGPTPLMLAAYYAREEGKSVQVLLDAGAGVMARDAYGRTVLHSAASGRELPLPAPLVKRLLALELDPNARDADGRTALWEAAGAGWPIVVQVLLRAGADPNIADREGVLPLANAVIEWKNTREGDYPVPHPFDEQFSRVFALLCPVSDLDQPDASGKSARTYVQELGMDRAIPAVARCMRRNRHAKPKRVGRGVATTPRAVVGTH